MAPTTSGSPEAELDEAGAARRRVVGSWRSALPSAVTRSRGRFPMQQILMVALGGAVGALLRYGLADLTHRVLGPSFPWGTLVVNLTGCFAIGFLWALHERAPFARLHPLVFTGTLGAFTTFSTFGLETFQLLRDGEVGRGLANVVASTAGGLTLVVAGFVAARLLVHLLNPGGAP